MQDFPIAVGESLDFGGIGSIELIAGGPNRGRLRITKPDRMQVTRMPKKPAAAAADVIPFPRAG